MVTLVKTLIDLVFTIAILVLSLYILLLVHSGVHWELPYVPTMRQPRRALQKYLKLKPADTILDMGSGLGRMLLFFSAYKVRVTGIEQRKIVYWLSKIRTKLFHPIKGRYIQVLRGDFFELPLKNYSVIYAFHIPRLIQRLVPKMERELQKGQILISYKFPYPLSASFSEEKVQDAPNSFFFIYRKR